MWHPKQLLHEKIINALLLGGFTPLQIEFLGWLSWVSRSVNNSRNPVKAAHTLLAKATVLEMLDKFTSRKMESIAPAEVETHALADKVFDNLQNEIDMAITKAQMKATTYEDYTKGGVSDGAGSITNTKDDEEEADAAAV